MNPWLAVAIACWLWPNFAPRLTFIPSEVNLWVAVIGGLAVLLVVATEVWPILRGVIAQATARRGAPAVKR